MTKGLILLAGLATLLGVGVAAPAHADDWRWHDGWHHGHPRWWGPGYYPPPVYYAPPPRVYYAPPPPVYYAPPPVVYAPPPVAYPAPGLSIGVNIPLH